MNNKKVKEKTIRFKDYPEFRPNLTPRKIFLLGSFGGTYWRPITSKVTKKSYKNKHKEFPKSWWKGIPNKWLTSPVCDLSINNYGVRSGTSLRFWEKKGWMNKQDPYGWVQWYCRFYKGRRTPDDKRQIKRWLAFAGPKGRFKRRLVNMIKKKKTKYNDYKISPVIRQGLQHWAYRLVPSDVRKKPVRKKKVKRKRKKVKRRRKFGSNSLEKYEDRIDNLKLKPVDKKKVEKILQAAIIRDKSSSENLNNNFIKKLEELKESKKKELINNEYFLYSTLTKDKIKGDWNEYQKLFPKENSKYTPEQVKKATKIVKQFNDFVKGLESATCMEDINEIKKNKNYNKIITKKVLKVGSKWEDINDTIKLAEKEYLESLDSEKLKKVITNIDNTCVNTEASGCINKIVYNLEGPDKKYSLKGLELEKLQKEKENEKDESKIKDLEKKIKKKQEEMNKLLEKQEEARITNECMIFGKKRKRKKVKRKRKRKKVKKKKVKRKRKRKVKRKRKKVKKKVKRRRRKFGKKTFLYNPNNPKTSFDVYINKNPKDTIPIKYTSIKDVKDTIRKLERLYKAKKYPHTRIWKVGMILKVRLEAMVKHTGKKKTHFKHSKNYFHFLGQRTTKKEPERRKMVFKFNKTYRKVNKVKRKRRTRKYGKTLLPKLRKISKKNVKHIYKLKDPHKKRILAIDEGIRTEAKKTGRTMKKAAIAKKARFNVLRIYRKNKKLGECNKLTRDMLYIDKKYKLGKTKNICKRKK